MISKNVKNLYNGFQVFKAKYFTHKPELFHHLTRKGQTPSVLLIACSDSRVDPAILFEADPGELFVIRNVANLVPRYAPDGQLHGTSSAIEFAVCNLNVRAIVVLGHSQCGGIDALTQSIKGQSFPGEFLKYWVNIAADAVKPHYHDSAPAEKAAIIQSIKNLNTFPWIKDRVALRQLELHGWWFNMEQGEIEAMDEAGDFVKLDGNLSLKD